MKGAGVERLCQRGIPHHGILPLWDPWDPPSSARPAPGAGELEVLELTDTPPAPPVLLATPRALQLPT